VNGNQLDSIPANLCKQTPVLRYLYLNNLKLTSAPPSLDTLAYLEQLDLSHNNIPTLPMEIFQLRQLYSFDISHNKLTSSTSGETWDTVNWAHECALEILDISFNSLTQAPAATKDLVARGTSVLYYGNPFSLKESPSHLCPYPIGWSEMVGRRPTQEDSLCLAGKVTENVFLFALFDGHAGRGAAEYAVQNFPKCLMQKLAQEKDYLKVLSESFVDLNENFRKFSAASKDPSMKHCGTTGVAILLTGSEIFVANVGDARAVMYTGGDPVNANRGLDLCSPTNVVRVSEYHKPDDEEERIRLAGGYVVDSRVNGFLGVSRSIGDFYIDPVICDPSAMKFQLPPNQDAFIVLACDGVWDELSDTEACSIVHKFSSQNSNPHSLSACVRDFSYFLGSDDNISVMVIKLKK